MKSKDRLRQKGKPRNFYVKIICMLLMLWSVLAAHHLFVVVHTHAVRNCYPYNYCTPPRAVSLPGRR